MQSRSIGWHKGNGIVIPAKAGIQEKYFWIPIFMGMTVILFLSGCATYEGSRASTEEREDLLVMREDINQCKSRLETMEIEQKNILNEIQQLRNRGQDESARARLDELERRIAALDAARAADKQAVVEQISGNVAKMMGGGASASKTAAKKTASSSSSTGYEHVVKEGETLSAIAAAYKVKINAIIDANDLNKPYILRKGQKLFIPQ